MAKHPFPVGRLKLRYDLVRHFKIIVFIFIFMRRLNCHFCFICSAADITPFPYAFQIGIIGENEEWLMVQQLANEPDARSLEVLDLNPYTYYR